ncbi:MAG: nitronate monooxygenase, partial [Mailhella sp.]|nr:nitronate monooxygenase [Mailhella sp.]
LEYKKGPAIPVFAGCGIYSGEDIANIMALGASCVQMGTRFVATNECDADIKFKEAFVNAKEEDITIINSPVGMPGRALFNSFIEAVRDGKKRPVSCAFHCVSTCTQEKTPYCIAAALIAAMRGNLEKGFAFCGTNVNKIKSIVSVKELMESLQAEYDNFKAKF